MTDAPPLATPIPDELLLARARGGDSGAREELFCRHFPVAQRVARRLLGDDQDALDAVQDGFLKAVRHLHEFDGRSSFRTWLLRVVSNAALDLGRRKGRRPSIRLAENDAEPVDARDADPAANLHRQDLRRALDAALATLSHATRSTFVLFAEAELSYKEIADAQRIPIGTVMSRLHFARRKLQALLGGIEENQG